MAVWGNLAIRPMGRIVSSQPDTEIFPRGFGWGIFLEWLVWGGEVGAKNPVMLALGRASRGFRRELGEVCRKVWERVLRPAGSSGKLSRVRVEFQRDKNQERFWNFKIQRQNDPTPSPTHTTWEGSSEQPRWRVTNHPARS